MVFLICRSRSVLVVNAHTAPSVHHEWLTLKHFTGCLTQPQMQKTKISTRLLPSLMAMRPMTLQGQVQQINHWRLQNLTRRTRVCSLAVCEILLLCNININV